MTGGEWEEGSEREEIWVMCERRGERERECVCVRRQKQRVLGPE